MNNVWSWCYQSDKAVDTVPEQDTERQENVSHLHKTEDEL